MIVTWGFWFWKARKQIPWRELAIVPAATIGLGDHASWNTDGLPLRWDTDTEAHCGWKGLCFPCKPGSPFYTEVRRLIASLHPPAQAA